jgi:hypothetical protein
VEGDQGKQVSQCCFVHSATPSSAR